MGKADAVLAFADQGSAILSAERAIIEQHVRNATPTTFYGHPCHMVNCTTLHSEVGNALLAHYNEDIALMFFDNGKGKRIWSIRGRGTVKVNTLAEYRGGGGHPSAAGFEENVPAPFMATASGV
jgi:nanoRNase/pAp phosphatase (c-di-AMP/oligoRNAs hydrolase)